MKKVLVYISVVFIVSAMSLAAGKSKGLPYHQVGSNVLININEIIVQDEETVVERKRAHKRKRKIRPKRNGF